MSTVEAIITTLAGLPSDQVAQVRAWLDERAEAEWDAQIETVRKLASEGK